MYFTLEQAQQGDPTGINNLGLIYSSWAEHFRTRDSRGVCLLKVIKFASELGFQRFKRQTDHERLYYEISQVLITVIDGFGTVLVSMRSVQIFMSVSSGVQLLKIIEFTSEFRF